MAIITITRGQYSGGEAVAENLARALGARCLSDEVLREAAKKYRVPEDKIVQAFERGPTFWQRMTEDRRIYLAFVQATLADWAGDDRLVYHGNGGQELLRDLPHVLKVHLIYPLDHRVRRLMAQFQWERHQAERLVQQIDEDRTRRTRYFFNSDWRDPSRYDATICMERMTERSAQRLILALAREPEYQLTAEKEGAFRDVLLRFRAAALVAETLPRGVAAIRVEVRDGEVILKGSLEAKEPRLGELLERLERMEGVRAVRNEVVAGPAYREWDWEI
jgi:cytidylate kinase